MVGPSSERIMPSSAAIAVSRMRVACGARSRLRNPAMNSFDPSPLGKATGYPDRYDPGLLFAIERAAQRAPLGLGASLPFRGVDLWTAYELSWLDARGKPQLAIAELRIAADSPATVESKSLKLYLGSFAQEPTPAREQLRLTIAADLERACRAQIAVVLHPVAPSGAPVVAALPGESLDDEQASAAGAGPDPEALAIGSTPADETLKTA